MKLSKIKKNVTLISFDDNRHLNNYLSHKIIGNQKYKSKKKLLFSGGNSLKSFFLYLKKNRAYENFEVYLSDERLLNKSNENSNFYLISKTFKKRQIIDVYSILREKIKFIKKSFLKCSLLIPNSADLRAGVLGVGDDGHIASIFNNGVKLKYSNSKIIVLKRNSEQFYRASLTLQYLKKVPHIYFIINKRRKKSIVQNIKLFKKHKNDIIFYNFLNESKNNITILTLKTLL